MFGIKRCLAVFNFMLLTAMAYQAVDTFYRSLTGRIDMSRPAADAAGRDVNTQIRPTASFAAYQALIDRNLFNLPEPKKVEPAPVKIDLEQLKQTDLKLKLWGTVTGGSDGAYAVIEDVAQRRQNLYRVDDAVQNAIVKEIRREKVILEVNGSLEVLEMEKVEQGGARKAVAVRQTGLPAPTGSSNVVLKRDRIEEAVNDLNNLMKQVRIRPHFKDGKPDGLTVSGIRSNSIFAEMGLRNGDVIVGVDGTQIQSVDDALKLYENLQSSSDVKVQIKRRGRLRTIDYQIQD